MLEINRATTKSDVLRWGVVKSADVVEKEWECIRSTRDRQAGWGSLGGRALKIQ